MLIAEIYITPKKTVSDPQGLTVKHGLDSLGFKGVSHVRVGKFLVITLETSDKAKAHKEVDSMCKKLLANPVIEDYVFKIIESDK
jgi:phosphoribosylformylglycinamidine synthase subunit PurS